MPMRPSQGIVALVAAVELTACGCYYTGTHGIVRVWADYNSLRRPAIFVEEIDHWPNSHDRVAYFRPIYGAVTPEVAPVEQRVRSNSTGTLAVPPLPGLVPDAEEFWVPPPPGPPVDGGVPVVPQESAAYGRLRAPAEAPRGRTRAVRANRTGTLESPVRGESRRGPWNDRPLVPRTAAAGAWLFGR